MITAEQGAPEHQDYSSATALRDWRPTQPYLVQPLRRLKPAPTEVERQTESRGLVRFTKIHQIRWELLIGKTGSWSRSTKPG